MSLNAYRNAYYRARRGPAYQAKQGMDGLLAALALATIIAISII